jgi:hypothetical protein
MGQWPVAGDQLPERTTKVRINGDRKARRKVRSLLSVGRGRERHDSRQSRRALRDSTPGVRSGSTERRAGAGF